MKNIDENTKYVRSSVRIWMRFINKVRDTTKKREATGRLLLLYLCIQRTR